jgi:hypothetical protein
MLRHVAHRTGYPPMTHALASDVQQGIVYGFENDWVGRIAPDYHGREEVRDLVFRASSLSRIPVPTIVFGGDRSWPCLADVKKWQVTINDWGRSTAVVLHEIAHLVTFHQPRGRMEMMRGQAHGPVFVRNAINLYSDFLGPRRSVLEQKAREFGLEIAPELVTDAPRTSFYDEDF